MNANPYISKSNVCHIQPIIGHLDPGLYRLTIDADACAFDWESLSRVLNRYGNVNERTGPWDFDLLDHNRPMLPAYWFYLDGRKLGLVYFNRPSATQIAEKRLLGEFGFWIHQAGDHEIRLEPDHDFHIVWDDIRLEPEPDDGLEPPARVPIDVLGEWLPSAMPSNRFTDGYLRSVTWAKQQVTQDIFQLNGQELPLLAAAWRWRRDPEALALCISRGLNTSWVCQLWAIPMKMAMGTTATWRRRIRS